MTIPSRSSPRVLEVMILEPRSNKLIIPEYSPTYEQKLNSIILLELFGIYDRKEAEQAINSILRE
jgi:hypothetical protein